MSRPRSFILLLTILALIYMASNWTPRAVEVVRYCPDYEAGGGFLPCDEAVYKHWI